MPSKKTQFHLYLDEEMHKRLLEIAPGYGAASVLVRELIAKHCAEVQSRANFRAALEIKLDEQATKVQ